MAENKVSKKTLTPAQRSANAASKPKRTIENKKKRALRHLKKHPNDECALLVVKAGKGPGPKPMSNKAKNAAKIRAIESRDKYPHHHAFQMRHPDDKTAGDYFRVPYHTKWKPSVLAGTAETMAEMFARRDNSDPFVFFRMRHYIKQGLGHIEDYTFKPDGVMRHA